MTIELSPEQQAALHETRAFEDPAGFEAARAAAQPAMDKIVKEVMEPNQGMDTTILELRDLYLLVKRHAPQLDTVKYTAEKRATFADAIRLVVTADAWFGEGKRTGAYRTRTIEEVLQASRPWRARLKVWGDHAFALEPDTADQFADVNSSGTLQEEQDDLRRLNELVELHQAPLVEVGMTPEFVARGKALLDEASGHGLLGIVGLRSKEEAVMLRNRIFTYGLALAREARAAGVNACFDDPEARRRFEAASFRNALRKLKRRRAAAPAEETGSEPKKDEPAKDEPTKDGAAGPTA